jgi:hypothetical protein
MEFFSKYILDNILYLFKDEFYVIEISDCYDSYYDQNQEITLTFKYPKSNCRYSDPRTIKWLEKYCQADIRTKIIFDGENASDANRSIIIKTKNCGSLLHAYNTYACNDKKANKWIYPTENLEAKKPIDIIKTIIRADTHIRENVFKRTKNHLKETAADEWKRPTHKIDWFDYNISGKTFTFSTDIKFPIFKLFTEMQKDIFYYNGELIINSEFKQLIKMYGYDVKLESIKKPKEESDVRVSFSRDINQVFNPEKLLTILNGPDQELINTITEHYNENPLDFEKK